eukprot:GHRR01009150.1.p1 GENE.GHRR01009150.1~~GHRR01009150.1.p1  ORF type:complete len:719 (+),score=143.14 GHRR01009150.1:255-2411(+)
MRKAPVSLRHLISTMLWITSPMLLLLNSAVLRTLRRPTVLLLVQLAFSTLAAATISVFRQAQLPTTRSRAAQCIITMGSASFITLYASINALHVMGMNVVVLFQSSIPVGLAAVDFLLRRPLPTGPGTTTAAAAALLGMMCAAVSLSMYNPLISVKGWLWLTCCLAGSIVHLQISEHLCKAGQPTAVVKTYLVNLISCVLCLLTMAADGQIGLSAFSELRHANGAMVLVTCALGFCRSILGYSMQEHYAALDCSYLLFVSKATALLICWKQGDNAEVHLLSLAAVAFIAFAWFNWQGQHQHYHKEGQEWNRSSINSSERQQWPLIRSILIRTAATCIVAGMLWLAASMVAAIRHPALVGDSVHARSQHLQNRNIQPLVTAQWQPTNPDHLILSAFAGNTNHFGDSAGTNNTGYLARLRQAAGKPINIIVMTSLFWALNPAQTRNCTLEGIPLDCHITQDQSQADTADCLYYHVPSFHGKPRAKAFQHQLRIAMSLESAAYYRHLDDPQFMCMFDAEMSYRTCGQVTNWYSLEVLPFLFQPPVPFEQKNHALAYINSNCDAQSGRAEIVRQLMHLQGAQVPVHSMGRCDANTPWPAGLPSKRQVQSRYKFCVAMENSIRHDYVTEKVWDALAAGCVPVYMGSRSALQMIPDATAVIVYDPKGRGNVSTTAELDKLMHQIGSDKERYESMLAWKHRQVSCAQLEPCSNSFVRFQFALQLC